MLFHGGGCLRHSVGLGVSGKGSRAGVDASPQPPAAQTTGLH